MYSLLVFFRESLSQKNEEVEKLNGESLEHPNFAQLKNNYEEVTSNYALVVAQAVKFSKLVMDSVPVGFRSARMSTYSKYFNDHIVGDCYQKFCKVLFWQLFLF